jgi:hypothetical protein
MCTTAIVQPAQKNKRKVFKAGGRSSKSSEKLPLDDSSPVQSPVGVGASLPGLNMQISHLHNVEVDGAVLSMASEPMKGRNRDDSGAESKKINGCYTCRQHL